MAIELTRDEALKVFHYDRSSGVLRWNINPKPGVKAGDLVGYRHRSGYLATKFKGNQYLLHRLIWLIEHGEYPLCDIDHINRDRCDNRIENLRLTTRAENCQNSVTRRIGASGVLGVTWHRQSRKWRASIQSYGRGIYLGGFESFEDAVSARKAGEIEHHPYRPRG
jgi:hypothetical protein